MKIAYIITAYRLPDQLARLVERLNADGTSFFLHIDRKTDDQTYESIMRQVGTAPNIHYLDRIICNWGTFGQVGVPLNAIQALFAEDSPCDYAFLLTGQCYPIKSNTYIQKFLQQSAGRSYINYFTFPHPLAAQWQERFVYWHIHWRRWHFVFPREDIFATRALNRLWNPLARRITLRRKIPGGLQPYFGGSHWCLSRECLRYVHEFVHQEPAFVRFFSTYVEFPSEIFFQTILLNSPLRNSLVDDDLSYIDFSSHKAHPAILTKSDFRKFMSTGDLFARKFDPGVDREVLDMIDREIR